jgi:hypothetical protein
MDGLDVGAIDGLEVVGADEVLALIGALVG